MEPTKIETTGARRVAETGIGRKSSVAAMSADDRARMDATMDAWNRFDAQGRAAAPSVADEFSTL